MTPEFLDSYAGRMSKELGRPVTRAEAEREVVEICYRVAGSLATIYRFGYHSTADVRQTGVLMALEVLAQDKYDVDRPLDNFLYVHMRNRLYNLKRKHYARLEAPCKCCDPVAPGDSPCPKWKAWNARNCSKKALMKAVPVDAESSVDWGQGACELAGDAELMRKIDRAMPPELRADYLRMAAGLRIPKARRLRLRRALAEVLGVEEGGEG